MALPDSLHNWIMHDGRLLGDAVEGEVPTVDPITNRDEFLATWRDRYHFATTHYMKLKSAMIVALLEAAAPFELLDYYWPKHHFAALYVPSINQAFLVQEGSFMGKDPTTEPIA